LTPEAVADELEFKSLVTIPYHPIWTKGLAHMTEDVSSWLAELVG
jgi:hypothetical protein